VHDTIELEKRGIPATTVITEAFRSAALFQFKGKGMEGHSYIELPHPISNLTPNEMEALSLRYVDQMARQLTA
jgi:hypothetical protein